MKESESTTVPQPKQRPWRMLLLKSVVLIVVLVFVWRTLRTAIDELQRADWQFRGLDLTVTGFVYIVGLLPAGLYWWWLLSKLRQPVSLLAALRAYFVGHLGKYVPGKAMVVVLRVGLIQPCGASTGLSSAAVVVETLTMMASGAAVAFFLVAVLIPTDWKLLLAGGLVLATGGPTLPPLLNRLLMRTRTLAPQQSATEAASITWKTIGVGWAAMLVLWLLLGLSVMIVLLGLSDTAQATIRLFAFCTAAVSLATVAGFLSLLPGGLVVRELILLELLAPQVGEPTALVAAVLLRIVWLVSELVVSGILYFGAAPSKH